VLVVERDDPELDDPLRELPPVDEVPLRELPELPLNEPPPPGRASPLPGATSATRTIPAVATAAARRFHARVTSPPRPAAR
jgi:hypothetical protein